MTKVFGALICDLTPKQFQGDLFGGRGWNSSEGQENRIFPGQSPGQGSTQKDRSTFSHGKETHGIIVPPPGDPELHQDQTIHTFIISKLHCDSRLQSLLGI